MDVRKYNEAAWDQKVREESCWTLPVTPEIIAEARQGRWQVILTPTKPVPEAWYPTHPDLTGCKILALASAGGQQGPVLAAAGATVTVFDNSNSQLEQDRLVAQREQLEIKTVQGDMADLSVFPDESFDLIFHPVSNCFIPDPLPVWQESSRVLKPGGRLLAGIMNPDYYIFDYNKIETQKRLVVRHPLPYSDLTHLNENELQAHRQSGEALEYSHTMESLLGGLLNSGFQISKFFEDRFALSEDDPVSHFIPVSFAIFAEKYS